MKPKLIIINGPAGVGKNTVAELYKNEHRKSVIVDIDEVRRTIPNYRENRQQSYTEACGIVYAIAKEHILNGFDVVIPNVIKKAEVFDALEKVASECNADFYECVLWADKEDAIQRAVKRGFRPNSLLNEDRLSGMYDELLEAIKTRKNAVMISSVEGETQETYTKLSEAVLK